MYKKRIGAVILSASLLTGVLAGCGNGESGSKNNKEAEQINDSLSVWISSSESDMYAEAFDSFRQKYPDVNLNVEVYDDANYETEKTKMNTQLMAGEGPDLLFLGIYGVEDVNKMMQSGVFASLSDYMKNDESYNESDYVSAVMDAGIYNCEQYVIPYEYSSTYFVSSKEALEEYGISQYKYDDYFSFMEMIDSMYDNQKTDRILADVGNFDVVKNMGINALDYENKKVNIDTDDVKRAYELYKKAYAEDTTSGVYDYGECILNRQAVLRRTYSLDDAYRVMATIGTKETPVIMAIPTVDGKNNASIDNSIAVRANSQNKQNAWNMIKTLLDYEADNDTFGNKTPVCKAGIANAMDSVKKAVDADVALGSMESYTIPDETIAQWNDIVSNVNAAYFNTSALGTELSDKMEPYLKGNDTYESCMKAYVSFADIYISE